MQGGGRRKTATGYYISIEYDTRLTSVFLRSGWFNVLSKVRVCTPEQLLEMSHEQANPKNAVVSL